MNAENEAREALRLDSGAQKFKTWRSELIQLPTWMIPHFQGARMSAMATGSFTAESAQRIQKIQTITIAWMSAECVLSGAAAWMARSPALLAFGADSAVELLSAAVVLWRFHSRAEHAERWAARIAGSLLFALAAFVVLASAMTLIGRNKAEPSYLGIAVLIAAALFMPWLAREKRRLSAETGSAALRADAAESASCAYLAMIALVGLVLNVVWHVGWADPIAALVIVPLVVREGWETMRGRACHCRW